jgi:hypothetical protein
MISWKQLPFIQPKQNSMRNSITLLFITVFVTCSFFAKAARPINGTTTFSTISASLKASGIASGPGGLTAFNVEGFNFNLTTSAGATMNIEVWDGLVATGNGVAFYESTSTTNPPISGITLKSNDGARFDFVSIGVNATNSSNGNATITITGLNSAGNPVSGASFTGSASAVALSTFSVSSNAAFKGIYGVRITSSDMNYVFLDNVNLANVGSTLSLTWLDFKAIRQDKNTFLNWSTATEQNTKDFTIQHSTNTIHWNTIGTLKAAGNSQAIQQYRFVHTSPNSDANYYRLLQADLDGQIAYSKIVFLSLSDKTQTLSVYPNPVQNGRLVVKLENPTSIQIVNSDGVVVLRKLLNATEEVLQVNNLPKGVYQLTTGSATKTFLIQ